MFNTYHPELILSLNPRNPHYWIKDLSISLLGLYYPMATRGYGADWDVWGDQFEAAFTQWPMAVGTGNHERDWPSTGDAFGDMSRDSGVLTWHVC
jgi:hypothetical protein